MPVPIGMAEMAVRAIPAAAFERMRKDCLLYTSTAPMVREAEIWIYGFDTFTPKNLLVIERLMKASKSVNIVMTYEPDNEMFELTKYVMGQLAELAERLNEEAVIKQIDGQHYMRRSVWNHGGGKLPVTLVAASSMYAEADRAA